MHVLLSTLSMIKGVGWDPWHLTFSQ